MSIPKSCTKKHDTYVTSTQFSSVAVKGGPDCACVQQLF